MAALLCAALPSRAGAGPPGGGGQVNEPGRVEVAAPQRRVTSPEALRPGAGGAVAGDGPTVKLADFLAQRSRRLEDLTSSQIGKMQRLIDVSADDDPQKPDFCFRLAELYAEKQRFYSSQARALDQKIYEASGGAKAELQSRQRTHEANQQKWLLEAVKTYVTATRFPRYERMDEVLFKLAYLLTSVKKEEDARVFFLRLIKDHPDSKYIPDAYLSFGDFYFDKGEMDAALKFYEKVEQFPRSSLHPYAVYKKGWCQVNLGDHRAALETFVRVVRIAGDHPATSGHQALEKEAKKDLVKAYAHVGGPDKAWEFFQRTGGDFAPKMLEALAELYWQQGQFADSTRVYRRIIATNAGSPRACEWQNKVVRNTLSSGTKRDQVQEIERLGAIHDKVADMKGVKKDQLDECRNSFHDISRELALVWHKEAQRTKSADTYALTKYVYRVFLDHFPKDENAYEMGFYYGELLWALESWKDAAQQYTKVVEMNPQGTHVRDAAYAAVLAWKRALDVDAREAQERQEDRRRDATALRGARKAPAPQAIPEYQQKMIAAFDTYIRYVPDAPELVTIEYRKARVYYEYDHYAEAADLFTGIVAKHPGHELAIPFSANLLLDCLNAQGKTGEVLAWVDKFLEMPEAAKSAEFITTILSVKSDGYDLEGRAYEKRRDFKQCARSMMAAAEARPEHPSHAERLWNAGQCFQNAHLVGRAIESWRQLIAGHPRDPLAQKALFRVAAGYHQLAYYGEAAGHYEQFARSSPDHPQARAALGNATVFREGLGHAKEALADMAAFVASYRKSQPGDAAGAFFQMAEVHEKAGDLERLRAHLGSYLHDWARQGGLDREVQAHFRLGELAWKASCPRSSEDGSCVLVTRARATRGQQLVDDARRRYGKSRRTQCGPPSKAKIVPLDRQSAQASAAEGHLRAAVRLWSAGEAGNPIQGRDAEARRAAAAWAAAGAAFYLAELDYEALLRLKFPQDLDFSRPSPRDSRARQAAKARKLDDSNERFTAYLVEKTRRLDKARAGYLQVFGTRQASWAIAAAARVGQLHQDFAGQLYTAEIPRDLPDTDPWGNHPRDLYCDALEDKAGKIEAQAIDAFKTCLAAATRQSWYSEWSRLCERELNQLEPAQFPVTSEMRPEADHVPTIMVPAEAITKLGDGG